MKTWFFLPCNFSYNNDFWRFHGIVSTLSSSDKLWHVKHVAWPFDVRWLRRWILSFQVWKRAIFINIGWGAGVQRMRRFRMIWWLRSYRWWKKSKKWFINTHMGHIHLFSDRHTFYIINFIRIFIWNYMKMCIFSEWCVITGYQHWLGCGGEKSALKIVV